MTCRFDPAYGAPMRPHLTPALERFWLDLVNLQILCDWRDGLITRAVALPALARIETRINEDHI